MPEHFPEAASVSVVIPCYRCSGTIRRAVESVARQTFRPKEVFLVEDASPDDTLSVLDEIRSSYPVGWIKVIPLSHNGGPSAARNIGWEASCQPYIAFLDADDSWHPSKIELQYSWMEAHPEVSLTGHPALCVSERVPYVLPKLLLEARELKFGRMLFSNRFSTPTVMLRSSIQDRFDESKRYAEDFQLWLTIAAKGHSCWLIDVQLAFLHKARYGESGLSSSMWKMEKGELEMYISLAREGLIPFSWLLGLVPYSSLKFFRRLLFPCKGNRS